MTTASHLLIKRIWSWGRWFTEDLSYK